MRRRVWSSWAVIGLAAGFGCVSSPDIRTNAPVAAAPQGPSFPKPAELNDLASRPVAEPRPEHRRPDVERYGGQPAPTAEQLQGDEASPWTRLLLEAGASRQLAFDRELTCLAREYAAFHLEKKDLPPERLQFFLAARCAVRVGALSSNSLFGDSPETETDAQLLARWRPQLEKIAAQVLGREPSAFGATLQRSGGRAVAMVVTGRRQYRLEGPVKRDETGMVELRGELLMPAQRLDGHVNQGEWGSAVCQPQEGAVLPRFHLRCQGAPGDAFTWMDLFVTQPGRLLGNHLADVLVWPEGGAYPEYVRPSFEPLPAPEDPALAAAGLLQAINTSRAKAGVRPLVLAPAQSARAATLAPYYFGGKPGPEQAEAADTIALGLMAGWDIKGQLLEGTFRSMSVAGSSDLGYLAATALDRPSGRQALLSPRAEVLGSGVVNLPKLGFVGALVTTHALYDKADDEERVGMLYRRLNALRKEKNLSPVSRIQPDRKITQAYADRLSEGELASDGALNGAMRELVRNVDGSVRGWYATTSSLETMQFPTELLTRSPVALDLAIAFVKTREQPWGSYCVLMTTVEPRGPQTAGVMRPAAYSAP